MEDISVEPIKASRSSSRLISRTLTLIVPLCLISLEVFLNLVVICMVITLLFVLAFALFNTGLFFMVTSPLWMLLFLFWSPLLLSLVLMLKFSSIRTRASQLLRKV